MHYMTHRSHRMQKHKFGIMCPNAFFMDTAPGPPEHEKYCFNVSLPGCAGMHYVTRISHQMQKHKFGITCPGAFFVKSVLVLLEHEK
jgi:hypothetical protein